ncbi:MAG TPA: hypothetical protein VIK28_04440, partial [Sedimentisphaerales bacterium]
VSFLSFANPEKGDPNSGMFNLLFTFLGLPTNDASRPGTRFTVICWACLLGGYAGSYILVIATLRSPSLALKSHYCAAVRT